MTIARVTDAPRTENHGVAPIAAPLAEQRKSAALKKLRNSLIMMVDDEATAIEVTRTHLHEAGYTNFISTTDPLQALGMLKELKPELLLLDLMMPGMSGLELLERIDREGILKDVPAIIMTASTDVRMKFRALQLGASEFLAKPIDPAELALRLSNTLAAKAYWSGCWESPRSKKGAS
ncbi:MAG: gmr 3 [Betaproteobacteria bacterium]|nr:gmr 3 [Betaproteobacteria bacterium]